MFCRESCRVENEFANEFGECQKEFGDHVDEPNTEIFFLSWRLHTGREE